MESRNIDKLFKEIIESSEDHYKEYSGKAQNYIWHEIHKGKGKPMSILWKRLAVAATILILMSLSVSLYFSKKKGDALIAELHSRIVNLNNQYRAETIKDAPVGKVVTIEKERIVKVPVITTVEKVRYVRDTVYIRPLAEVHNEREINNNVHQVVQQTETVPSTEIILTSTAKKKKKRTFSLERYLQKKHESNSDKESGSIMVFTAKL